MTPPDCTEEIEGNDELRDWAESLRDQVSRISGRKIPGFSAELKGDLLDAIDMLVEQASGEAATNPLDSALEKIQGQIGEATQKQSQELQAATESLLEKLSADLVEGSFDSKLTELTNRWQHAEEVLQRLDEENVDKEDQLTTLADQFCDARAQQTAWQQTQAEEFFELKSLVQRLTQENESRGEEQANDNEGLREQLNQQKQLQEEAEKAVAESRDRQAHLESEKQELSDRLNEVNQLCKDLQQRVLAGSDALRELVGENRELCLQREAWKSKRARAMEELEELRNQYRQAETRLGQTEAELSERSGKLEELEEQQIELFARVERLQEENEKLVEELSVQVADNSAATSQAAMETQLRQLEERAEKLKQENESLTEQLSQSNSGSAGDMWDDQSLSSEERMRLESEIDELNQKLGELEAEKSTWQNDSPTQNAHREEQAALERENQELHARLSELEKQLESAEATSSAGDESDRIRELKELLTAAKDEIETLQDANEQLNAKLDGQQSSEPTEPVDPESLSWEDRKRLIMQQFEEAEEDSSEKRMEVEDIVASTEQALQTKDQVIQELQQRLQQQQTDSPNPVDLDAAVQQEREKLHQIQAEWQEKIRQAEIDLSAERAKLARERTQLEGTQSSAKPEAESKTGGRTRKWLDHLGLRDPKKQ